MTTSATAVGNAILDSLPASSVRPLLDVAEHAVFRLGETLQRAHEPAGPPLFVLSTARARLGTDALDITHDFLALMLGASRARLSLILANFERRGFIRQERGRVVICDVPALRRIACDCAPHDLGCA